MTGQSVFIPVKYTPPALWAQMLQAGGYKIVQLQLKRVASVPWSQRVSSSRRHFDCIRCGQLRVEGGQAWSMVSGFKCSRLSSWSVSLELLARCHLETDDHCITWNCPCRIETIVSFASFIYVCVCARCVQCMRAYVRACVHTYIRSCVRISSPMSLSLPMLWHIINYRYYIYFYYNYHIMCTCMRASVCVCVCVCLCVWKWVKMCENEWKCVKMRENACAHVCAHMCVCVCVCVCLYVVHDCVLKD